jgi:hypothetical protein
VRTDRVILSAAKDRFPGRPDPSVASLPQDDTTWQPHWKRGTLSLRLRLLLLAGCVAVGVGANRYLLTAHNSNGWMRIASDSLYVISIDPARVIERWGGIYDVWYLTDHAIPHMYKGASFNREIVESLLRCNTLSFKILRVDMSMRGGRTVSRQRTDDDDIRRQPWRSVEPGSTEADAARATCERAPGLVAARR